MREALREAKAAARAGDVPIGAVAVWRGQIIGRGRNRKEEWQDPTAHAEILALREAAHTRGSWRLSGVTLYSTTSSPARCAPARSFRPVSRSWCMAWGEPLTGAAGSIVDLLHLPSLNHRVDVISGVLADEVKSVMDAFFRELREHRGTTGEVA